MRTHCKFQVEKVTRYQGTCEQITLNAVYGSVYGSVGEDRSFAQATPNGKLDITVTNPEVVGNIKPGEYYYIDLVPVVV